MRVPSVLRVISPSLEVRAAIDDLYNAYLWALDTQDIDLYIGVFWDDAELRETQLDGTVETWVGAPAIRDFTAGHFTGYGGHQHRETTRRYLPAGDGRWELRSYWFASHRDADTNHVEFFSTGLSRDVVEERDGEWRFAVRGISRWPGDITQALARLG